MSETVNFTINIGGNAYIGIAQLDKALGNYGFSRNLSLCFSPAALDKLLKSLQIFKEKIGYLA